MAIKRIVTNKGVSLVEMLIYIALLVVIFVVIIDVTLGYARSYRNLAALRVTDQTAVDAMERMTREIRASGVIDGASVLGTSPGTLILTKTSSGVSTTTKFYVQSGELRMDVNNSFYGPLSPDRATITSLTFTQLTNSVSKAIKIAMTVTGTQGEYSVTKTYHSTVVLKGT